MTRRFFFGDGAEQKSFGVERGDAGQFRVRVGGNAQPPLDVRVLARGSSTLVTVAGRVVEVFRARNGELVTAGTRQPLVAATRPTLGPGRERAAREISGLLRAPMPGRVVKVFVAAGDEVSDGASVVVVEAMKMENELSATRAGVVKRVLVRAGDTVERGAVLLELE